MPASTKTFGCIASLINDLICHVSVCEYAAVTCVSRRRRQQ